MWEKLRIARDVMREVLDWSDTATDDGEVTVDEVADLVNRIASVLGYNLKVEVPE